MARAFHIHTVYSDGNCTVAQILQEAYVNNVTELAICDHDTLLGSMEASKSIEYQKSDRSKLKSISGIEISAKNLTLDLPFLEKQNSLHILGYNFDLQNSVFNEQISNIRLENNRMCKTLIENLSIDLINLKFSDIKLPQGQKYYFKTNVAEYLVEKGYASDINTVLKNI